MKNLSSLLLLGIVGLSAMACDESRYFGPKPTPTISMVYPEGPAPAWPVHADEGELLPSDFHYFAGQPADTLMGHDALTDRLTRFCLESASPAAIDDTEYTPESMIRFDRPLTLEETLFATGATPGSRWHLFDDEMPDSARGPAHTATAARHVVLTYGVEYRTRARVVNPEAQAAVPGGVPADVPFRGYCGDEFLGEAILGARAFVQVALAFEDDTARDAYEAEFPEAPGVEDLFAWLLVSDTAQSLGVRPSVSYFQTGGDVVTFWTLMASRSPDEEAACKLGNGLICATSPLIEFMNYALGSEPDGLHDQAIRMPGFLGGRYVPFSAFGGPEARVLPDDIREIREALSARYDDWRAEGVDRPEDELVSEAYLADRTALDAARDLCFFVTSPGEPGEAEFDDCRDATRGLLLP